MYHPDICLVRMWENLSQEDQPLDSIRESPDYGASTLLRFPAAQFCCQSKDQQIITQIELLI